jgi:hypothetical protein
MGKRRSKAQRQADAEEVLNDIREEQSAMGTKGGDRWEQRERDLTIFRAAMRGVSPIDLAVTYGLHPKTVTEIVRRCRQEGGRLSDRDPLEVAEEVVEQIEAGISELATASSKERGAARVTAISARIKAIIDKGKWMQSSGLLPQTAQEMNIRIDADQLANGIMDTLDARGLLTPEVAEAMLEVLGIKPQETFEGTAVELPLELEGDSTT